MKKDHVTVLLDQAVDLLVQDKDGTYVDGTFGRGGHSRLILSQLSDRGELIGIDKDPTAIEVANTLKAEDGRFDICHGSFADLKQFLNDRGLIGKLSGLLLDLGVSSPQLDNAERGFSFMQDGPLDMRMNTTSGQSAADWIAKAKESELADVFYNYGEERFSRRIAKAIVERRAEAPFLRTLDLAEVVKQAHPKWEKNKHPATRVFQAIRIFINNELGDLEQILEDSLDALKPGGRLVVISFHSLEDRIVKRFIKLQEKGKPLPADLPIMHSEQDIKLKSVGKALKPTKFEVEENVRARSAVMRTAERL